METGSFEELELTPNHEINTSFTSSYAPWYTVPHKSIVSVEHPFIIQNTDKAIESLGGSNGMTDLVHDDGASAKLYIWPGDRTRKPLQSANVNTNNILLRFTVPKRTGLKRKRGSTGPYHDPQNSNIPMSDPKQQPRVSMTTETQRLSRTLRDHPQKYTVEPVGTIERTHRFRGMPDFVFSTADMPLMQKMKEHILPFDYENMKDFRLDLSKGPKPNAEVIPPPRMTLLTHPFNYTYRQNPTMRRTVDGDGTVLQFNDVIKVLTLPVPYDVAEVPPAPSSKLIPVENLSASIQQLIKDARLMLCQRPIYSRRALRNLLPNNGWDTVGENAAKRIYQYIGYSFSSGPWRDTIVKFGVDPRKDVGCRIYQSMMFMLEKEPKDSRAKYNRTKPPRKDPGMPSNKQTHVFDGTSVQRDGKVWQVCDISEPILKNLLATENLREECHTESDGWYQNGTWAKVKIIMKAKIQAIRDGMPQPDALYANVAGRLPDTIKATDSVRSLLGKDASMDERNLTSAIRVASLSYKSAMPGGQIGNGEREMISSTPDEAILPGVRKAAEELESLPENDMEMQDVDDGIDVDDDSE